MYVQESLDAEPTVFLDPNTFSDDGTVALRGKTESEPALCFITDLTHWLFWKKLHYCNMSENIYNIHADS